MALAQIVADKRQQVLQRKRDRPLATFQAQLGPSDRSLKDALRQPHTGYILECKKASPSQGVIRPNFDPAAIAQSYAPFCDAISVLTDEPYFGGSFDYLRLVREHAPVPVLCKDFVVDSYQIDEARGHGADAILLMCSVLSESELQQCLDRCRQLHMDALVEVHDADELRCALRVGAEIIGINNRNLQTLEIDLSTTQRLAPMVPRERCVLVCESGIRGHHDVRRLRPHCDAFLIGTSLMAAADLDLAVRELIFGRVKVCGLTNRADAQAAWSAGASFGGIVLWSKSPRHVSPAKLAAVVDEVPLRWCLVSVNARHGELLAATTIVGPHVLQLHGDETAEYIHALRPRLGDTKGSPPAIWRALRVGAPDLQLPLDANAIGADRLLFDAYQRGMPGGTGNRFDWQLVSDHPARSEVVLSGGLKPENAAAAADLNCWALDLSSGVEAEPGRKAPEKLQALFRTLRG